MCIFYACNHKKEKPSFKLVQCPSIRRSQQLGYVTAKLIDMHGDRPGYKTEYIGNPLAFCDPQPARNEFFFEEDPFDCHACSPSRSTGHHVNQILFSNALLETKDNDKQMHFRMHGVFETADRVDKVHSHVCSQIFSANRDRFCVILRNKLANR